jgi:uncharacterized membrane protein
MRSPLSPLVLFLIVFVTALLFALVQIGALSIAFHKLGLSPQAGLFLLFAVLLGSGINVPLFTIKAENPPVDTYVWPYHRMLRPPAGPFLGRTLVAVNVGGCLIPLGLSLYLLLGTPLDPVPVILAVILVSIVCYTFSRPMPRLGIAMPVLIAPLTSAVTALILQPGHGGPLAYVCGTLGVLIGADILRLRDVPRLGAPLVSIGGAGTFDGIFITGIVAVLLA